MSRITRPGPRRPARWYPKGTTLRLRDGRTFRVEHVANEYWTDPSFGHGGVLEIVTVIVPTWREVSDD